MQNQQGNRIMKALGSNRDSPVPNAHNKRMSTSKDDGNSEPSTKRASRPPSNAGPTISPAIQQMISRPATAPSGGNNATEGNGDKKPRNRNRNRNKHSSGQAEGAVNGASDAPVARAPAPVAPAAKFTGARNVAVAMDVDSDSEKPAYLTDKEFRTLDINPNTVRALIEVMKFKYMTRVQHDSLPEILRGHDALVKAKTGTGKTVGFLVPSIEVLLKERLAHRRPDAPVPRILVLSPTRELAQQIAAEANALCTFHNIGVTLLVGGTNMSSDVRNLNRPVEGHSDIVVATPGRMGAHLKETNGFAAQMRGVKVFVMDEADRLLDMGFKKDIDEITSYLNRRDSAQLGKRQTLLFSATVANDIQQIAKTTLLPGYKFIDTVGEEVEQTHAHVPQHVMTVPLDDQMRAVVAILEEQKRINPDYKMILFFPTARQTGYFAQILNSIGMRVLEIHSRKSQSQRTKTSEEFRSGRNLILLSSDVSARGMDYPDVSFVLQVGMTVRDQYIHRLGRTARAGKEGVGMLLLAPFEQRAMLEELKDMPLVPVQPPSMQADSVLMAKATRALREIAAKDEGPQIHGEDSDRDGAKMAWAAWLGYYNGMLRKLHLDKAGLVQLSGSYAMSIGLQQIPALPKKTIGKMGMQGVPGLRIESASESKPSQPRNGGGGGRGGGGGNQAKGGNNGNVQSQQQSQQRQSQGQQSQGQGGRGGGGGSGSNNAPRPSSGRGGGGSRGGRGGGGGGGNR